jgi:hypothetical protein
VGRQGEGGQLTGSRPSQSSIDPRAGRGGGEAGVGCGEAGICDHCTAALLPPSSQVWGGGREQVTGWVSRHDPSLQEERSSPYDG